MTKGEFEYAVTERAAKGEFEDAVTELAAKSGLSDSDLADVFGILKVKHADLARSVLERFALVLDMPVAELAALQGASYDLPAAHKPAAAPEREQRAEPDQFSLVVDARGRATLRLNLVDVPMERAMRAMGALTSAGLLGTAEATSE